MQIIAVLAVVYAVAFVVERIAYSIKCRPRVRWARAIIAANSDEEVLNIGLKPPAVKHTMNLPLFYKSNEVIILAATRKVENFRCKYEIIERA